MNDLLILGTWPKVNCTDFLFNKNNKKIGTCAHPCQKKSQTNTNLKSFIIPERHSKQHLVGYKIKKLNCAVTNRTVNKERFIVPTCADPLKNYFLHRNVILWIWFHNLMSHTKFSSFGILSIILICHVNCIGVLSCLCVERMIEEWL